MTRYFAWDKLEPERQSPVKGHSLSAEQIVGTVQRARPFIGGPIFLVRLAPVDYHHVHYPDHGRTSNHDRLGHRLWTINWHALLNEQDILFSNERDVNILETRHFGRIAFVEIGVYRESPWQCGRLVISYAADDHVIAVTDDLTIPVAAARTTHARGRSLRRLA